MVARLLPLRRCAAAAPCARAAELTRPPWALSPPQLLSPSLQLLRPARRKRGVAAAVPIPDFVPFTEADFADATGGLQPSQFVDYLALVGDAVDCIPGVADIGDKTALTLLRAHGSLKGVLSAAAEKKIGAPRRAATALAAPGAADSARLSAQLARLQSDVDVPLLKRSPDAYRLRPPADFEAVRGALAELEFYSLQRRVIALWAPF